MGAACDDQLVVRADPAIMQRSCEAVKPADCSHIDDGSDLHPSVSRRRVEFIGE
jgi:hypothetical protein